MKLNRRNFVAGVGATVGAAGLASKAGADESVPVEIATVYPIEDVVVLENVGDEDVDLTGYQMDWGFDVDEDQTDTFPEGVTIDTGEQLSVWTGFQSERVDSIESDVTVGDHDHGRINHQEPNTLGLRTPSGEIVVETDDTVADDPAYNADEYDDEPEDDVDEEPIRQDVEFEYRYTYELGDDSELDDRLELSSAEYYYQESDAAQNFCYVEFDVENLTDNEEMTVYLVGGVSDEDGESQSSHEDTVVSEPGETQSVSLTFPECIDADGKEGHVYASVTRIEEVEEAVDDEGPEEDDEDVDEEPAEEPEEEDREDDVDEDPEDDHNEKDESDSREDETDTKDEDCPDEEDDYEGEEPEKKVEKSEDEDCPEEEPEPEPEPDDDC